MSLRLKFNLVLIVVFLLGLAIASAVFYSIVTANARNEVLQTARIMMQSAGAIRAYTDQDIGPLLAPIQAQSDKFLPQTIPFFAAEANFRVLQKDNPEFSYKEAALNPTNPSDRASDWEADIINVFRNDPARTEMTVERQTPTGPTLVLARPVQVSDNGCLTCHSTPAAAPAGMIKLYGTANGFGWKLHEIVGASVVSVPLTVALNHARQVFLLFVGVLVVVFLLIMILLNILLRYMVIGPVTRISRIAEAVSLGKMDTEEYELKGSDEIASLSASFNRLRRSLEAAMAMLDK